MRLSGSVVYGDADNLDVMQMMTVLNAKERTLEEFKALALSAGWKVVSVDRCSPPIPWGFIVAVPV